MAWSSPRSRRSPSTGGTGRRASPRWRCRRPSQVPAPRDPYEGLLEPIAERRPLRLRRMFGCWAYYADDCLVWVSAAGRPPWHGILVPTERQHHAEQIGRASCREGVWIWVVGVVAIGECG